MHESRIVADLIARAETESSGSPAAIKQLTLRIGALSGVPPDSLRHSIQDHAAARWGHRPEIAIDESSDPMDSAALGVVLVSILLDN